MTELEDKLIQKLMLHFFKGSLNFTLEKDEVNLISWTIQEQLIHKTLESNLNKKFPVRNKFLKVFLKKLLMSIEPVHDIHDHFYSFLCAAINNENDNNNFYYKHYVIDNDINKIITIKETNNMVINGTTGMKTWEAALVMADWSICNQSLFNGKKIIELGSGIGFTGITIAKFCNPESIILTDFHDDVIKRICDNIEINFSYSEKVAKNDIVTYRNDQTCIGVMHLDWNDIRNLPQNEIPDIVLGADIVYDPSILQPLCNVLQALSEKNKHLQIYICSIIRNEDTIKRFFKCLDDNGFEYIILKVRSKHIEWEENIELCLLKILPLKLSAK